MEYRRLRGASALPYVEDLGRLRIAVFREFPYLYDGDMAYERKYLENYFMSPDSLVVLAIAQKKVVGATTGIPLSAAEPEWRAPFKKHGPDERSVFYFGESVLLSEYRGRGVGARFFDEREKHAADLPGITTTAFCAVRREHGDPRRPSGYRSLDAFWSRRGYRRVPELTTTFKWKEIGEQDETPKLMDFWLKTLR